jgi:predicted SprT family Zn-dependent metalloprotease
VNQEEKKQKRMPQTKYFCRICGTEIDKERYEDHDELCESCEGNEKMDEDEDFEIAFRY